MHYIRNQISNNLANNLVNHITQANGPKIRHPFWILDFGIKVIKVWLIDFRMDLEFKQERTA